MSRDNEIEHNISITDVVNVAGFNQTSNGLYRGEHPVHGSSTGNNIAVNTSENVAYCFRHQKGGGPLLWIALKEGVITCEGLGQPLKGKQAVETCKLANEKYGADIDVGDIDQEEVDRRRNAQEVLDKAVELTHGQLQQDDERWNRIKSERTLDDEDIEKHKIGYWNDTVTETLESRFDTKALIDSGLFKVNCTGCDNEDCNMSFKNLEAFNEHCKTDYSKDDIFPVIGSRVTFPYRQYGRVSYFIGRRTKEQEDYWYGQVDDNLKEIKQEILDNPEASAETLDEAKTTWVSRQCGKYVKICETSYNNHIIWQELEDRDELVITEGIYDAISTSKAGYSVASPITTRFNSKDKDKIVNIADNFETVHLVFDGDTAGKDGQQETAQRLTSKGIEPNVVVLEAGKDLDDWTNENGYEIQELLESGERYLDTLINKENEAEGREAVEIREDIYEVTSDWDKTKADWIFEQLDGGTRERRSEWKKHKEKVLERKEKERKREELPETEEEDNGEITDQLEVPESDHILYINPRPSTYINQLKETATKRFTNSQGTVDQKPIFQVYEVQFGQGNEEETWNLLVEPYERLTLGENKLPIKEANLLQDKYKNSDYFQAKFKKDKKEIEGFSKSYEEWLKDQEGSEYLELQDRIDGRSKQAIRDMDNEKILQLVREYLKAGWYTDPKLRKIMYPQMIQHKKAKVKPGNVAKYQPHTQMWTNTKVGKSKTAQRVGRKIDETSTAGLLGYADTDGKQQGQIDGLEEPVFLDEFNFGNGTQQINDNLLPLLEEGYFEQTKAGHSIKTRLYSNISYLANPQESELPEDKADSDGNFFGNFTEKEKSQFELVSQFEELIDKLGMNIQAMASRFGVVVFDETMDEASAIEDGELSDERFEKLEAFIEWVRSEVSKEYTEIEREMRDWLEEGYDESYTDHIEELAEDTSNEKVEKFWKNHIHNHRHARGQALRMAVFQHIGNVIKDDYDLDEIRQEADKQWETVKEINTESLEKMTKATDEEQELSRARSKIDSYKPKYLRVFVKTVIKYHQENGKDSVGMVKLFDDLKPVFKDLKHELPDSDVNENSKWWKWNEVRSAVEDQLNQKRLDLSNDFGIEISRNSGEELFRIKNGSRFKSYYKLDIPQDSTSSSSDDDDNEDDDGRKSEGSDQVSPSEGEGSDKDIPIEGEYDATPPEIKALFDENEQKYENRIIPESDIVNYFGRRHGGSKYNDVQDSLSSLSSNGTISEVSSEKWQRVRNN